MTSWARTSPLFGRRTAQIHLQPFGYLEAAQFHPRWSPVDRAKAYGLVGGLPQYLLGLDDSRSIDQNIRLNLMDEFAPLFHEPTFLLREELREVAPYQSILFAVAAGRGTVGEIAATTGCRSGTCTTTCSSWWRSATCGAATPWSVAVRIRSSCVSEWTIRCCVSGSGSCSPT